ncbi:protein groucho-like isoform X2 [Haematobia irritans]|uniref:protein groucho-like isoform X2 n=1 Tax=Haematobia irritans TaxID=7368 RepID=UPI003F507D24
MQDLNLIIGQVPGVPPQPMGALGPLGGPFGAFGASMGLPHGPQGLLKAPPEHHRPDIKPTGLEGPASAEERLESHSPRPNGEHMSMEGRDRESLNGERLDKPVSSGRHQTGHLPGLAQVHQDQLPALRQKIWINLTHREPKLELSHLMLHQQFRVLVPSN